MLSDLLQSLRRTQAPRPENIPVLFPRVAFQSDLTFWIELIQQYEDAEKCFLISIVHYKCRKGMEHEFILARVQHPSDAIAILCLDRSAKQSEHTPATKKHATSLHFPARDRIVVSADGTDHSLTKDFESCIPLRTLTFPENAPRLSLAQFSTLLSAITPEDYQAYERACYWFAGATWEALRSLFPHAVMTSEARKVHPSTYRGIFVSQDYATKAIVDSYDNAWQEIKRTAREEQQHSPGPSNSHQEGT